MPTGFGPKYLITDALNSNLKIFQGDDRAVNYCVTSDLTSKIKRLMRLYADLRSAVLS